MLTESFIDEILESDDAICLGEVSPTADSKGAWSELFYYEGKLYNIVYSDSSVVCGEEVPMEDLNKFVDDPMKAYRKLKGE